MAWLITRFTWSILYFFLSKKYHSLTSGALFSPFSLIQLSRAWGKLRHKWCWFRFSSFLFHPSLAPPTSSMFWDSDPDMVCKGSLYLYLSFFFSPSHLQNLPLPDRSGPLTEGSRSLVQVGPGHTFFELPGDADVPAELRTLAAPLGIGTRFGPHSKKVLNLNFKWEQWHIVF